MGDREKGRKLFDWEGNKREKEIFASFVDNIRSI